MPSFLIACGQDDQKQTWIWPDIVGFSRRWFLGPCLCDDYRCCHSYVRHKLRQSYISRTVWPSTTKFNMNLHAGRIYSHTRYDITRYYKLQLNTAQKCVKRVRPAKSRIIWSLFNLESHDFMWIYMPIYSTATPDMTPSTTSGRHFSKFEKRSKLLPPAALCLILAVLHFACPTN